MCQQCVAAGSVETTWDHWCKECLTAKPWMHRRDATWKILLRKLGRLLTGRFTLRIEWK
jgi:hypothetical protein